MEVFDDFGGDEFFHSDVTPFLFLNANKLSRFTDVSVCISAAPAAFDRYLAAVPAMSLIPFTPFRISAFQMSVFQLSAFQFF